MLKSAKKPITSKSAQAAATPRVATKITAKPVLKATAKAPTKPAVQVKVEKPVKVKKTKLVRDSFTIPKTEYSVLDDLKQRAGKLASPVKKSELLRAGIKALAAMSEDVFLAALKAEPAIKTGRPAKN